LGNGGRFIAAEGEGVFSTLFQGAVGVVGGGGVKELVFVDY